LSLLEYPPRLNLARIPTPLELLPRASDLWGRGKRIWVKRDDLTGSVLTGNKVRKLEFIAAHALENGYKTLVTCGGVQSNHCRATALVAAQLGLGCHLVLRSDDGAVVETGNFLIDQLAGASYEVLAAEDWSRNLRARYASLEADFLNDGNPALMIPVGGSDSLGIWGYIAATEELQSDIAELGLERVAVTLATGSAGTQAGLTAGAAIFGLPFKVIGYAVCDDSEWFNARVRADWRDSVARWGQLPDVSLDPITRDHSVGPGYARATADVYKVIADLARVEGLVLDPVYTAKGFKGLIEDIECGFYDDVDDIVFIHTGGVFGIFSHADPLLAAAHA